MISGSVGGSVQDWSAAPAADEDIRSLRLGELKLYKAASAPRDKTYSEYKWKIKK